MPNEQLSKDEIVFVAVCSDRHIDEDITVHRTQSSAIEYAREYMRAHVANPSMLEEHSAEDGRRWWMTYMNESDNAYVVPARIR